MLTAMVHNEIIIGLQNGKPVIVIPKEKLALKVVSSAKGAVVYAYLEDDAPVSKLHNLHSMDADEDVVNSIIEAVENIEMLEDEADGYSDIALKDVDRYTMGELEGGQAKRIEEFLSLENRLLEAREALNALCHRIFDKKLIELGIIEAGQERLEEKRPAPEKPEQAGTH